MNLDSGLLNYQIGNLGLKVISKHYQSVSTLVLPWWLSGKEATCNAGNLGVIPELRRAPGEGNGNPLQYSCLGNPMERGAKWTTVHGVTRVGHNLVTRHQQHVH